MHPARGSLATVTASHAAAPATEHVRARVEGALGRLTLDRPRALNALDLGMVRALRAALDAWEHDTDVETVLIDGAGDRGFCAGGDVRGLHDRIAAGDTSAASTFFREEYALDARIAEYPKPVVVVGDGVTMGGGVGLAGHAAIRIVTETSQVAMPETRIGFTPDVGGSLLLGRAPGRLGEYLALTGTSMDASDAIAAGFADHLVPAERLPEFREALARRADPGRASELVLVFDETPPPSRLAAARAWIDDAFAAPDVPAILDRLRASGVDAAQRTADELDRLSPTALVVTLASVRRARGLDLRGALAQEYGLAMWFAATQPDLPEGIRAQLVDKDRRPRWRPDTLAALPAGLVDEAFAFVPEVPLWPEG